MITPGTRAEAGGMEKEKWVGNATGHVFSIFTRPFCVCVREQLSHHFSYPSTSLKEWFLYIFSYQTVNSLREEMPSWYLQLLAGCLVHNRRLINICQTMGYFWWKEEQGGEKSQSSEGLKGCEKDK